MAGAAKVRPGKGWVLQINLGRCGCALAVVAIPEMLEGAFAF